MTEAYIFDAIRTPRGKGSAKRGALKDIKPIHLLSQLYGALEDRTNLDNKEVQEILLGCVAQIGDQGADIAKISAIHHGWGDHIDGTALNSFCTASLSAINGYFKKSLIPVKDAEGNVILDYDESIRPNTTVEGMKD